MIYIGIDPGIDGAWAWIEELSSGVAYNATVLPLVGDGISVRALEGQLAGFRIAGPSNVIVALEKAQAMPKNGAVSMFNYGRTVGRIEATLSLMGFRVEEVRPTTWKKVILADTAKDKAAAIEYVTRAFPALSLLSTSRSRKAHDGMADAVCLAEYCRRVYGRPSA